LAEAVESYLPNINIQANDRTLTYISSKIEGTEVLAMLQHGLTGVDADITSRSGEHQYHLKIDDTQHVGCGCLFRLPPHARQGLLTVHIPNGRGIKTMLETHLRTKFSSNFSNLMLDITPYVMGSALEQAIANNAIGEIKLVKRVQPSDRGMFGLDQWVGGQDFGKIELSIGARFHGHARHLRSGPLQRWLSQEPGAHDSMIEFQGVAYDEMKVVVPQSDGGSRTFYVGQPDLGHPMTENMKLGNGKPSVESIYEALRAALRTVRA
jgi:hypothetical protein